MTQDALTAQAIAEYLSTRPDFFEQHADLFANLNVPHPHQARAISLGERQILTLRDRAKAQERRLAQLLYNAGGNERINQAIMQWCARMLAEPDSAQIPAHIIRSLGDLFDLSALALRVWDLPALADSEFAQDVTPGIREYAAALEVPYCGPLAGQEAAAWLASPPASVAIMALRPLAGQAPVGLLVLGSDDPERFTEDMGTAFLEVIALLAGAALGRLADPAPAAA
ncbi:DUF484 family protein [Castellaniella sp. S9]|uniref:DUF484 family protein n=1 Tax=Castellaniella sp. S9 TaxID=2993652 RepID=UPI0022B48817|nr:DUF484 family protein [Castellaniella sp. S9]